MAINKIEFGGSTLIDLTADTVTSETLLSGVKAHNKSGELIEGSMMIINYTQSSSEPKNSEGSNGDLWLVI